jgi:hypothetical protein
LYLLSGNAAYAAAKSAGVFTGKRKNPDDRIVSERFCAPQTTYEITIHVRFGTPAARRCRPGSALLSSTSFSAVRMARSRRAAAGNTRPTRFETFVAVKRGAPLSPYATHFMLSS